MCVNKRIMNFILTKEKMSAAIFYVKCERKTEIKI